MNNTNRKPNTTCDCCQTPIYKRPPIINDNKRKFCSYACRLSVKIISKCYTCGSTYTKNSMNTRFCREECKPSFRKRYAYSKFDKKANDELQKEIRLILTKWKWGFVDEVLYLRTYNAYANYYTKPNRKVDNMKLKTLMSYCINKLKAALK